MTEPIRVLLVDDQPLLRESFRLLVDSNDDLTVVGEADDGVTAIELARNTRPDVVLMDVRMPTLDGIEATQAILGAPHAVPTRILMLTMFGLDSYVFAALRAGASGFLLKDTTPAELLRAIRIVATGEALLAPGVTRRLIEEFCRVPERPPPMSGSLSRLTGREHDVLALVTYGMSNVEIADRLNVSVATVKTHLSHLFQKLGARDRVQLVIAGYENGVVVPGNDPAAGS